MYIKKKLFILLIIATRLQAGNVIDKNKFVQNPRVLIFDIGPTLVTFNSGKALKHISSLGTWVLIAKLTVQCKNVQKYLTNFYFEKLNKIKTPIKDLPKIIGFNGQSMPELQVAAINGNLPQKDIIKIARNWIEQNPNEFPDDAHKYFFNESINLNFNADILIENLKYNSAIKDLEYFYKERDSKGKRKNICIVIGYQPRELTPLMKHNFEKAFKLSDLQILSWREHLYKEDPKFYEYCLSKCPTTIQSNCYFIDEQQEIVDIVNKIKLTNFSIKALSPKDIKSLK